jgi:hypothetical protein
MSGIELCHALTIEFYNANSHLVVCRLKYLGFQYYHEWNSGSIYVRIFIFGPESIFAINTTACYSF